MAGEITLRFHGAFAPPSDFPFSTVRNKEKYQTRRSTCRRRRVVRPAMAMLARGLCPAALG
eukprot:7041615-Prymnesium_polylepis.1